MRHMPHLDGLRCFAVAAVLIHHWFQSSTPIGDWGVTLFFVISGFLITGAILRYREEGVALWRAAAAFFLRRSVRLLPAYYLALAIGSLFFHDVRQDWAWYVGYASDLLIDLRSRFVAMTPTWSLAIEEQFYVVWFFAVMLLDERRLRLTMVGMMLLAPVARFYVLVDVALYSRYHLWLVCDALAAGAFMAARRESTHISPVVTRAIMVGLLVALGSGVPYLNPWIGSVGMSGFVLFAAALVWKGSRGFEGLAGAVIGHPAVVYLGKISYGIYLYHMLTPTLGSALGRYAPGLFTPGSLVGFASHCVMTASLASMSFHILEQPLRGLIARRVRTGRRALAIGHAAAAD